MSNSIHEKFLSLIKKGAFGTISVAECTLRYETFISKGAYITKDVKVQMRDALYEVLLKGPHPTMNPFMDQLLDTKDSTNTFKDALLKFIDSNLEWKTDECDQSNDVITMKLCLELLTINCLPFFDQEKVVIEKASVQTALFKYNIEE